MATDDHGECINCGFNLNGERIYDTFLEKYGDEDKALEVASMYGATKDSGRWGLCIYIKSYDKNYNKLPSYHVCPKCGERCYNE